MAKNDVVKPGQFKVAGRLRPGKDTNPDANKHDFTTEKAREEEFAARELPKPGAKARRKAAAGANARRG